MHQKTKQFQTAKNTLELIANNSDEILMQMDVAATTNIDNLKLYFENLRDIYNDIAELTFDSKIDDVLTLRAELTDFLGCFEDNIVYYNCIDKLKRQAAPLLTSFDVYMEQLDQASEYDVRANIKLLELYRKEYTLLAEDILAAKTKPSIIAVTVYRSLINVFENFFNNLQTSISKDSSIYDIIQYMTILDALKYYYVDSVKTDSFYSMMLQTKISNDSERIKSMLDDTSKLDGFDFKKMTQDIKTYQVYLQTLKEECEF
jgi:hypothetical protein